MPAPDPGPASHSGNKVPGHARKARPKISHKSSRSTASAGEDGDRAHDRPARRERFPYNQPASLTALHLSHRVTRRRTAFLIALVMLFASLAPALSHALASASDSAYRRVEACTTQGIRIFVVATDGSVVDEVPVPASVGFEHCQFCALPIAGGPPPAAVGFIGRIDLTAFVPPVFLHAPRTPHVWLPAHARAPPSSL